MFCWVSRLWTTRTGRYSGEPTEKTVIVVIIAQNLNIGTQNLNIGKQNLNIGKQNLNIGKQNLNIGTHKS